jgi:hypothetical protein
MNKKSIIYIKIKYLKKIGTIISFKINIIFLLILLNFNIFSMKINYI